MTWARKAGLHGLDYKVSVAVHAPPEEGFAFLTRLVESGDADALWIVKQNLRKKRPLSNFPQDVKAIERRITSQVPLLRCPALRRSSPRRLLRRRGLDAVPDCRAPWRAGSVIPAPDTRSCQLRNLRIEGGRYLTTGDL
ncbi:MAG: hypothetical protein PVG71_10465 [Anaerolineae bacterium]|jgi:hypothetical protein